MAGDTDKFGLFRTTVLIVRFTTAVVVLHLIEALVWAIFYRCFCLPSWEAAFYFSAGSYGTVGCSDVSLPPNWRALGPLESITGALMCGISVSQSCLPPSYVVLMREHSLVCLLKLPWSLLLGEATERTLSARQPRLIRWTPTRLPSR